MMNDDVEGLLKANPELAREKAYQLEGSLVVLKPFTYLAVVATFVVCFWWYDIGLLFSIGAALLSYIVLMVFIAIPVGYVLGQRAARRYRKANKI